MDVFKKLGTTQQWIDSILAPFRYHAGAAFAVAASFASILFKEFNLSQIIVDISGYSSNGKTTVLNACASVWEKPIEYMTTISSTKVGVERLAGFLNTYPLVMDDTNTSNKPHEFQNIQLGNRKFADILKEVSPLVAGNPH
ncbi:DUF927 domain-containing protein [Exiguobacterium sp. s22]|uniref:DUF927 domain-containing protein n=1 Tax=Exiguobacterium sp. s22 TaxID=2751272 RepID=UPI001BEB23A1|nr:DUF927 domain-containing protein [Exiguobacterium sp. s22]